MMLEMMLLFGPMWRWWYSDYAETWLTFSEDELTFSEDEWLFEYFVDVLWRRWRNRESNWVVRLRLLQLVMNKGAQFLFTTSPLHDLGDEEVRVNGPFYTSPLHDLSMSSPHRCIYEVQINRTPWHNFVSCAPYRLYSELIGFCSGTCRLVTSPPIAKSKSRSKSTTLKSESKSESGWNEKVQVWVWVQVQCLQVRVQVRVRAQILMNI